MENGSGMRVMYLLRHGEPAFPDGERLCLGRTDLLLSVMGRMQAALAAASLPVGACVYCSGLLRCRQTAEILGKAQEVPGLEELSAGDWDGLPFREIRSRWPEHYRRRGEDALLPPPGGETSEAGARRVRAAFLDLLQRTQGTSCIVAHAGVNRLLLCEALGLPLGEAHSIPQPYGCVNVLHVVGIHIKAVAVGTVPHPPLTDALCLSLHACAQAPPEVVAHCRAVAAQAERLAGRAASCGPVPDLTLLRAAALLHDIARTGPRHAETAAAWLHGLGYPAVGKTIAAHHDLPADATPEEELLFLADKLTVGEKSVTLEERFARSSARCLTREARDAHARRYRQARLLFNQYRRVKGDN